jgi:hypothetical protein
VDQLTFAIIDVAVGLVDDYKGFDGKKGDRLTLLKINLHLFTIDIFTNAKSH